MDLPGADAAGTHVNAPDRSLVDNFDPLQVGQETAQRFSDDLGTSTAGPFDLTAAFVFGARDGAFMADNAFFRHVFFLR